MSLAGMGGIAPPAGFGGFGEEPRHERPAPVPAMASPVPAMAAPVPTAETMAAAGIPVCNAFLRSTNILANLNFFKCADFAFAEHKAPAPPENQVPVPFAMPLHFPSRDFGIKISVISCLWSDL